MRSLMHAMFILTGFLNILLLFCKIMLALPQIIKKWRGKEQDYRSCPLLKFKDRKYLEQHSEINIYFNTANNRTAKQWKFLILLHFVRQEFGKKKILHGVYRNWFKYMNANKITKKELQWSFSQMARLLDVEAKARKGVYIRIGKRTWTCRCSHTRFFVNCISWLNISRNYQNLNKRARY